MSNNHESGRLGYLKRGVFLPDPRTFPNVVFAEFGESTSRGLCSRTLPFYKFLIHTHVWILDWAGLSKIKYSVHSKRAQIKLNHKQS